MHDSKLSILLSHLERGWALVPLHNVDQAGACSCGGGAYVDHGSAGKHPRGKAWQDESQLVRDKATLEAIHAASPEWNWGVATGRPSGMWVLDWDVDHDVEIQRWLIEVRGWSHPIDLGEHFATLTLGPTGGGGRHYVFELPPDYEPRGSQTRNRYGLPPGLDVRGWHGQIVVAPSVSGKGPYGHVLHDAPIRRAPPWLEEMLRPQPEPERITPVAHLRLGGLEGGQDHSDPNARALAYARSAVAGLLQELASAPDGTRDDTTIRVAFRLVELANAPWSGYSLEVLEAAWTEYRMMAADRGTVERELPGKWRRAVTTVGSKMAELPPSYAGTDVIPLLDFAAPPAVAPWPPAVPFTDPAAYGAHALGGAPSSVSTPAPGGPPPADPVEVMIGRMLTPEALRALPPPRPLVDGVLDLDTCAWLIGKPGSCKSFVALDFAVHVGLGQAWRGRRVAAGLVVYIVAEGARGMRLRVDAVEREYGEIRNVLFLPEPVPADERRTPDRGAWSVLVEACRRLRPALVIIDTQARVTIGLKENDSGEMGYYVEQADRIRQATGACVLTVHHLGRQGTNARGSSAIDGAQDSEIRVERAEGGAMLLRLHMDKQKDQAEGPPIEMGLRVSDGGADPETGRDLSSLVIVRQSDMGDLPFMDPGEPQVNTGERRMVALYHLIVDRYNAGDGGTKAEIRTAFMALAEVAALKSTDGRKKAWDRAWSGTATAPGLVPRGLIAQRAGAARFKVVVLEDQSAEGVLTPNMGANPTLPPEGWNLYLPDESPRN